MITLLNYGLTNCITKILEPIEILGQKIYNTYSYSIGVFIVPIHYGNY